MSLAQIEAEIIKLTNEELDHLQAAIQALRQHTAVTATPTMLAERRRLIAEATSGQWGTDLPEWQKTRALDKEKSEEKWAS